MKTLTLALLLTMTAESVFAQITDPVNYYIRTQEHTDSDKFYKLEIDINNDGKKDILMTSTQNASESDSKYFSWTLYLATDNGYVVEGENRRGFIDETTRFGFRMDKYVAGYIPEIKKYGLLVLDVSIPSRDETKKQKATLRAIVIEGNGWVEHRIGESVNIDDKATYKALLQRFPNPPTPSIQEVKP